MEIKRRKIAQAEIFKTEQKFVTDITEICQGRDEDFRAIGYELVLEFGQKDSEYQKQFDDLSDDTAKKFESGYVSRAIITIKRQKTEEEKQEEIRLESEMRDMLNMTETEEEAPVRTDEDDKRSVAFTRVMLVRAYKSFWTEWISIGGDLKQLKADLDEFFEVLSAQKAEQE